MLVEVKIKKAGKKVLIRSDKYHINTFGKNLDEALKNFREAFLVATDGKQLIEEINPSNLTIFMPFKA